jgi:hypothetical protein
MSSFYKEQGINDKLMGTCCIVKENKQSFILNKVVK